MKSAQFPLLMKIHTVILATFIEFLMKNSELVHSLSLSNILLP